MSSFYYPCQFTEEPDGSGWNARIPDLDPGVPDGPMTCGDTLEEARAMARELVDIYCCKWWDEGTDPPAPSALPKSDGWELVGPNLPVESALRLRQLRLAAGLTQAALAKSAGISQQAYAKLEDPNVSNPTAATLVKVSRALGLKFHWETRAPRKKKATA